MRPGIFQGELHRIACFVKVRFLRAEQDDRPELLGIGADFASLAGRMDEFVRDDRREPAGVGV